MCEKTHQNSHFSPPQSYCWSDLSEALDSINKRKVDSYHVVDTEWHPGMVGMPISDEDLTSQITNGWKRLNTLGHYSIPDQARMKLVSRHQTQSLHSDSMLRPYRYVLCCTLNFSIASDCQLFRKQRH